MNEVKTACSGVPISHSAHHSRAYSAALGDKITANNEINQELA
jgi:hypothetical protein